MAVIIDDMEVVVQPPEDTSSESAGAIDESEQQRSEQIPAPHELMMIFRQQLDRLERVRVH